MDKEFKYPFSAYKQLNFLCQTPNNQDNLDDEALATKKAEGRKAE